MRNLRHAACFFWYIVLTAAWFSRRHVFHPACSMATRMRSSNASVRVDELYDNTYRFVTFKFQDDYISTFFPGSFFSGLQAYLRVLFSHSMLFFVGYQTCVVQRTSVACTTEELLITRLHACYVPSARILHHIIIIGWALTKWRSGAALSMMGLVSVMPRFARQP